MRQTLLFITAILLITVSAQAQRQTDLERSRLNTAAYYNYSEPGDVTILVHVWGAMRFTGLYEVPKGTKMSELFSLAGGPQFGERSRRSKRTVTVKLVRTQGTGRVIAYQTTMENEIVVTDSDPLLANGDVLSVESVIRQGISWRDIFPVIAAVASVAVAVDQLSRN